MSRDVTINNDVTMLDSAPANGAKRFRSGDEILGRYVVESELGQGGMGVVYLCLDKVSGVKVAVKGLPPEVSHNSDEMEGVRDNFQIVSELQHPNIAGVRTLEKDAATGDYFLVMAYANGVSLKRWLRGHGSKEHRADQLRVLRQIAAALDYAHGAEPRHVIHRDIKPENVMVDEHGNAMVLDFGLAAQVRSSLSRVSQVVTSRSGTPAYKSPEQWLAQAQRAPSDQYSLGVIAYQMFAGELPFDSDDIEILKHAVTLDPVPGIVGESRAVNAVFAKVLAKKPQDRFDSCSAFVDALEGKKSALARSSQDWRFMVAGGLLVLAALSVAGWWLWYELVRSDELMFERARQVARAKRDAKQQEAEAARMAAEKAEAERKAKDVAQRIEEERRKDEEARRNAERDEAARKAKDEAERIVKEKARASEGERKRKLEDVVHRRSRNDKQLSREETQKAIELFKKGEWRNGLVHAENGDQSDPELQFWIGTCYDMGLGANCDAQKAIVHFRRAAEMGQVDAQCELGRRYESGLGVSQDLAQAKRWYQAAASRGSKSAEKNLRRLYDQESAALSEQALAQRASLSQRRREREEAARKERKTEQEREREAEKLREIKEELARLRESARNGGDGSALSTVRTSGKRQVSVSGRSSVRFTREDADTLAQLKFSSPVARKHYERACKLAREGAHNKTRVKSEYDTGRVCGGPEWPELEAWLDWWR